MQVVGVGIQGWNNIGSLVGDTIGSPLGHIMSKERNADFQIYFTY